MTLLAQLCLVPEQMAAYLETKDYVHFQLVDQDGLLTDEFEGYDSIKPAYPGDFLAPDRSIQITEVKPPFVGVLYIKSKTIYGMSSRGVPIYFFEALDPKFPPMIVGCSNAKDYDKNIYVIAKFENWNKKDKYPRGILQTILGECGNIEIEKAALLHRYSPFPHPKNKYQEMPTKWLDNAYQIGLVENPKLPGFTFNIDPPGCEDVDDVFTIQPIYDGYRLTISITDVACALAPFRPVYEGIAHPFVETACRLGQSLYPDDRAPKHMIPPYIGVELLSLLPGKLRNVISLTVDWTPTAGLSQPIWSLNVLSVNKAYTYEEAKLEKRDEFTGLRKVVDAIAGTYVDDSHKWVETLMLFYNKEAGKLLKASGIGILRGHDAPDEEKLKALEAIHPDLKSHAFSSAKYVEPTATTRHWGIGADAYAHASSPLRRYADLYNQICIRYILLGKIGNLAPSSKLLRDLNRLQKDAKAYERDLFFLNVLSTNPEKKVSGTIVTSNAQKVTVYIPEWQRIIHIKQSTTEPPYTKEPGAEVNVTYYVKADCARWKEKIIFHLEV